MRKAQYQELFLFAAKAGSLEGYLFKRDKVEALENCIGNISEMYQEMPSGVREEVNPVFVPVLERALEYGKATLEAGLKEKLEQMLMAASAGMGADKA